MGVAALSLDGLAALAEVDSLFEAAKICLDESSVEGKLACCDAAAGAWRAGDLAIDREASEALPVVVIDLPGRPPRPVLVATNALPQRGFGKPKLRAALFHALAHIEFNAVDLAWDAVYRFRGLPRDFYDDWVSVAVDEAAHFRLLRECLHRLDTDYGDLAAHNGLWEMAVKTADNLAARMALVPRVLEARSLDVTPMIAQRLRSVGDHEGAAVIARIEHDELAHVQAGSRWFRFACERDGLDADAHFLQLVERFMPRLRGPFNQDARRAAGFSDDELVALDALAG